RYFTHGGATVALSRATWTSGTQPAPEWFFLFGDHQGSAQLIVDAVDPTKYTRTAYTPYGTERGDPTGTAVPAVGDGTTNLGVDRGWLAQVNDGVVGSDATSGT